mgnify:CR=1 FL=1
MTDKYSGHTSGLWMPMRNYMAVYSDQMKVCDIRGWGHLTGKGIGALGLSDDEAIAVQTANARLIADAPKLLDENKRLRVALKDTTQTLDMVMEECHETVWETVGGQVAGAIYEQIDEAEKALKESEDVE